MAVPPPPQPAGGAPAYHPAGPPQQPYPGGVPPQPYPGGAAPQYPAGPPQYPNVPPPPGWGPTPPPPGDGSSRRKVMVAGSVAAVVAAGGGVAAWLLTRGDGKTAAPGPTPAPTTPGPVPPPAPPNPEPPAGESGPYTLTLWLEKLLTPGVDQAKTNTDLAAALLKADPFGTARTEVQDLIDRRKLDTALAAGNGPDIFQAQTFDLAARVRRGELLDLTPYASRLNVDAWHPAARAACTFDGKLYALPMDVYAPVVVYDKRLCDPAGFTVPRTRDEWITQLDKLKRHHASDPKFEALHLVGKAWQTITACLYEDGCEIAVREGERWAGRLGSPAGRAGIGFYQKLQAYSTAPKDVEEFKDPAGTITAVLAGGKAAMMIQPDWVFPELLRSSPETARNLAAFPMPGNSADKPGAVGVWGGVLAVSAKTAHPAGAVNMLRVLASATWQERWATENETVPALAEVTTAAGRTNVIRPATLAALKQGRPYPQAPGWTSAPLKDFAGNVLAKGLDPEAAGRSADATIAAGFDKDTRL
ncbi:ABC transporter substrate-binding protein [Embleya sp. NPDC020886]|uniref:ABC transporter substrate-binding protein n=1 Tax=Embleya sp. NPDC020886 TaxID=3363980 RepID=UPI0037A8C2C2